jgi:hypothetical protein
MLEGVSLTFMLVYLKISMIFEFFLLYIQTYCDAPRNSLIDSTINPKVKTMKGKKSWGTLPNLQHFGVEGRAPRCGLR